MRTIVWYVSKKPERDCGRKTVSRLTKIRSVFEVAALLTFFAPTTVFATIVSSVLPTSRSVQVGDTATAFATIINAGPGTATSCSISPPSGMPGDFLYQTTDPATNALTGTPNTPVDIPEGGLQTFVFAFTPTSPFAPIDVRLNFDCTNTNPADSQSGLNTLLLSASSSPVPDIIALATGNGVLNLPASTGGNGAFAVATVNVGTTGTITVSANTGSVALPVTLSVCQTNPSTGACVNPTTPAATATTTIADGDTPTFAVFATATGPIAPDYAVNRAFVSFTDAGGIVRGSTSVALSSDVPWALTACTIGDSGWDEINEVPIVPKSFAEYQASIASCTTASGRPFTTNDVAGKTLQEVGASGYSTFAANGTGTYVDPGIETIPFTWFIDGSGYLVLEGSGPNTGLLRETMALVAVSGNTLSVKNYYEDQTFSDMVRESGADGEIWGGLIIAATTPPNASPTAVDDSFAVTQGMVNLSLDVLSNDTDPNFPSDTLTITDVGQPDMNGIAVIDDNGTPGDSTDDSIDYTPAPNFSGTETFTYTIKDEAAASSTATVTVVVSSGDIMHYWRLDEAGPPTYLDTVGSASASCISCPSSTTGLINTAQDFDGVSDELSIASTASINWGPGQSFTIEFWIRKNTACVGDEAVIGRADSQTQLKWWVGCDGSGSAVFELFDENGSGQRLAATTTIDDGEWHHVAVVRDATAGQNRLYVDGTLKTSRSVAYAAGFTSQTTDLNIGWLEDTATDYHFAGIVDEVAIHAGVVSNAEISQHYMDGFVGLRRGYLGCTNPVRIMPLGDSITRRQGYRPQLFFDLLDADFDVDFVGSVADGSGTHDRDNEGHSGFNTSDIAAQLDGWLGLNPPEVILLHIGTNEDPSFPYPSEAAVEDLLNIIDGFDPDISVVLARIINKVPNEPLVTQFNDNVEAMAQARIANGDKIIMVDQESALNYLDDMEPDGIHPNSVGFAKMVPRWFNGVASFLPVCPPP